MKDDNYANRKIKDALFSEIFKDKENLKQLHKELFPKKATEDIEIIEETIETLITNGIRNDLSYRTNDSVVVFMESQSSWNNKDLFRFSRYFWETIFDLYERIEEESFRNLEFHFFVLYTGNRDLDLQYSLTKDYFKNSFDAGEFKLTVLSNNNKNIPEGILEDYNKICKKQQEIYQKYGRTKKAVKKLFEFCIENNLFPKIFYKENKEFVKTMQKFDSHYAEFQAYIKEKQKESRLEGRQEGLLEGKEQGLLEGKQEGLLEGKQQGLLEGKQQGKLENEQTVISNMLKKGLDVAYIHEITDIPIERIESLKVQ